MASTDAGTIESTDTSLGLPPRQRNHFQEAYEDSGKGPAYPVCPRGRGQIVDIKTGLVLPRPCGRFTCPHCGPLAVRRRADAILLSGPEAGITFTFPDVIHRGFSKIKTAVTGFLRRLRRKGHPVEMVYVVENDPGDEGEHVHAVARGIEGLDPDTIEGAAHASGFGNTKTHRFKTGLAALNDATERSNAAGYLFKGVIRAPLMTEATADALHGLLSRNRGRPEHHTASYFRMPDGSTGSLETVTIAARRPTSSIWRLVA